MIAHQTFNCPKCGAPGEVNYGLAEYSCHCRFGAGASIETSPYHDLPPGKPPMFSTYMTDDGPIQIREDMPREQMWLVLQRLMETYEAMRAQNTRDWDFTAS